MTVSSTSSACAELHSTGQYAIVVAQANNEVARVLARLLELLGHTVEIATDGHSALKLVEATRPDIVMSGIALGGLDGYELARAIRERLEKKPLLVAHTSYGRHEVGEQAKEAGFDLFLPKPMSMDDLKLTLAVAKALSEANHLRL